RLPGPYQFRAWIQSFFSILCGAISGQSHLARRRGDIYDRGAVKDLGDRPSPTRVALHRPPTGATGATASREPRASALSPLNKHRTDSRTWQEISQSLPLFRRSSFLLSFLSDLEIARAERRLRGAEEVDRAIDPERQQAAAGAVAGQRSVGVG